MENKYIMLMDGYEDTFVFGFFNTVEDAKEAAKEHGIEKFIRIYELASCKDLAANEEEQPCQK